MALGKPPFHSSERLAQRWQHLSSRTRYSVIGWVDSEFTLSSSRYRCAVCPWHTSFRGKHGNTSDEKPVVDVAHTSDLAPEPPVTPSHHRSSNIVDAREPGLTGQSYGWRSRCSYARSWLIKTLPHEFSWENGKPSVMMYMAPQAVSATACSHTDRLDSSRNGGLECTDGRWRWVSTPPLSLQDV